MISRLRREIASIVAVAMLLCTINVFAGTSEVQIYSNEIAANGQLQPQKSQNLNYQNYEKYGTPIYSYLVAQNDGYMRVEYYYNSDYVLKDGKDGSGGVDDFELVVTEKLFAEYYDEEFKYLSGKEIDISGELPNFAGFYAGSDGYYVVFVQELEEFDQEGNDIFDVNAEYMRVVKYDTDWNRLFDARLTNNWGVNVIDGEEYPIITDVARPVAGGSLRMEEHNGHLYIHTCYEEKGTYTNGFYSKGHQMSFIVDLFTNDLSVGLKPTRNDVLYNWVSHSFNQFILIDNGNMVTLSHGDANNTRGAFLGKYIIPDNDVDMPEPLGEANVISWYGSSGQNYTGASLGGLEQSATSYLVAGNTVIQDENYASYEKRNIFITATSKEAVSALNTKKTMLTNYEEDGKISASTPHLVKFSDNRFLVMWTQLAEDRNSLYKEYYASDISYVLVDGNGTPLSEIYTVEGELTDCKPIVKDGKAVWYASGDVGVKFYTISSDGSFDVHSVNGIEMPNLKKIETSTDGVYLEWEPVEGASGYEIVRIDENASSESSVRGEIFTVPDNAVSYVDDNAYFNGKVYNYLVYAYNDSVRSYGTLWNKIEVLKGPYPTLQNDASGVSVSWAKVDGATGYKVYRYGAGQLTPETVIDITNGAVTGYKDKEVISGQSYDYRIQTIKNELVSPLSVVNTVKYISMPQLTLENYNSGTFAGVLLKWNMRNDSMKYYLSKWCVDLQLDMGTCSFAEDMCSYVDEEVMEEFTYRYSLWVSDGKGNSSAVATKTIEYIKPSPRPTQTPTPSKAPVVSESPSEKPVASESPSEKPVASESPSENPVASVSPSEKPVASVSPSEKPVVSESPSEKPVASVSPSEKPVVSESPSEIPIESAAASQKPPVFPAPILSSLKHVFFDTELTWIAVSGAEGYVVTYYDIENPEELLTQIIEGNENTVFLQKVGKTNAVYGYKIQAFKVKEGVIQLGESSREVTLEFIKPENLQPSESKEPDIAPKESKEPDAIPTESKEPDVTPTESKEPDATPTESKKPDIIPTESANPQVSEKPLESNPPESDNPKLGDVDLNGFVELRDAQLALRAALMLDSLSIKAKWAADTDKNQMVELRDAQKILRVALMLDSFD